MPFGGGWKTVYDDDNYIYACKNNTNKEAANLFTFTFDYMLDDRICTGSAVPLARDRSGTLDRYGNMDNVVLPAFMPVVGGSAKLVLYANFKFAGLS